MIPLCIRTLARLGGKRPRLSSLKSTGMCSRKHCSSNTRWDTKALGGRLHAAKGSRLDEGDIDSRPAAAVQVASLLTAPPLRYSRFSGKTRQISPLELPLRANFGHVASAGSRLSPTLRLS